MDALQQPKKNFTVRLSKEIRERLTHAAAAEIEQTGRYVSIAQILSRAVTYGLPLVEREQGIDIALQDSPLTEKERVLIVARQVIEKGFASIEGSHPGAAA